MARSADGRVGWEYLLIYLLFLGVFAESKKMCDYACLAVQRWVMDHCIAYRKGGCWGHCALSVVYATCRGMCHSLGREQKYKKSQRCSAGADKWLDQHTWDNTRDCLSNFKERGFNIVTTHMAKASVTIQAGDHIIPVVTFSF